MNFRYELEKYNGQKSRYTCPNCNTKRSFSKYIDLVTGEYVGDSVGRCNRENKCGYHLPPKDYHFHNGDLEAYLMERKTNKVIEDFPVSHAKQRYYDPSVERPFSSNLYDYLITLFDVESVKKVFKLYKVGSTKFWPDATVFWQENKQGEVKGGKVMLYDSDSGKRVKKPYNQIKWMHSLDGDIRYRLEQCLFGEHLLRYRSQKGKMIGIVESEKTALIASLEYDQVLWMSCGGLQNLSINRLEALKNRDMMLYPDADAYELWKKKGDEFGIRVSDYLEKHCSKTQKENGFDLADLIISQK